jgi:hypothetical protein
MHRIQRPLLVRSLQLRSCNTARNNRFRLLRLINNFASRYTRHTRLWFSAPIISPSLYFLFVLGAGQGDDAITEFRNDDGNVIPGDVGDVPDWEARSDVHQASILDGVATVNARWVRRGQPE